MARVRGNIFGITGKLGDKVYKIRNGKTYISRLPETFHAPMDEASVMRRQKFSLCQKFSQSINKLPLLQYIWKKYLRTTQVPGKIFSHTYRNVSNDDISRARLTPEPNFVPVIKNLFYLGKKIIVVFEPLGNDPQIWIPLEHQVCLNGVLSFINKDAEMKQRYLCFPVSSAMHQTVLDAEMTFELPVPPAAEEALLAFPLIVLHTVLVTTAPGNIPQKKSMTLYNIIKEPAAQLPSS